MTMHSSSELTCAQFAEQLPAHLEHELEPAARAALEAHAARCDDCGALLLDLRELRTEAAALPPLAPSRDLWAGIAERIDAKVIPIEERSAFGGRRAAGRPIWRHPALAAAALIVFTAGITHYLTRKSLEPGTQVAVVPVQATSDDLGGTQSSSSTSRPASIDPIAPETSGTSSTSTTSRTSTTRPAAPDRIERRGPSTAQPRTALVARTATPALTGEAEAVQVYGQEIIRLRRIVARRRAQLDPATIAVIERNLAIIDTAIVQSRAAIARDPVGSGFLNEQLNRALEQKVTLLRTAAMLPTRS